MESWNSIYQFATPDDMLTRIRRLERGRETLRAGQLVSPSGDLTAIPVTALTDGVINLASPSAVTTAGSIPPNGLDGKFGFSATASSISIYWDGTNSSNKLTRMLASGKMVQIIPGSITISGLAPSTSYGFLPYWSAFNDCGIGWIVGDSGKPQFAFTEAVRTSVAAMQQVLQGREPLSSGYLTYSTTSGGSSSGSGGGNPCVMLGTDIEPLGENSYSTKHHPNTKWVRIESSYPRALNCTPDHPLFCPDYGKTEAAKLKVGNWIVTDDGEHKICRVEKFIRVCTLVQTFMPRGHLFWANGYLSHNMKIAPV